MDTRYVSYGGKILTVGGNALSISSVDPYNPLGLPPFTIRLLYTDGFTPSFHNGSANQISVSPNVWDLTYQNTDWTDLLFQSVYEDRYNLLEILGANSTGVTKMNRMCLENFYLRRTALFDTSTVTDMNGMFSSCRELLEIPPFNTSSLTSCANIFERCSSITTIPNLNTSKVTNLKYMFSGCKGLLTCPILDLSSTTSVEGLFTGCEALTTPPLLDTSHITNFDSMFHHCISLQQVPLYSTGNADTMAEMFIGCTGLKTVPLLNTSKVRIVQRMFYGCVNVERGALDLYNQMSTQSNPPAYYSDAFYNCGSSTTTGSAELAQIPHAWGGTME